MPYMDGTGPNGLGPRTGRGMGRCTGGIGRGRGMRRGFGCPVMPLTKEEESEMLKKQKAAIESRLKELD